jgi:hypothetical protein
MNSFLIPMPPPLLLRLQENPQNKSRAPPSSFPLTKQLLEIHRNFRSTPNSRNPQKKLKFSNFTTPLPSDSQTKIMREKITIAVVTPMLRYRRDLASPGGFLPATTFCPSLIHHILFVILPIDFRSPILSISHPSYSVHNSTIWFPKSILCFSSSNIFRRNSSIWFPKTHSVRFASIRFRS